MMTPRARSKLPVLASSNQVELRRNPKFHVDVERLLQQSLDRLRPQPETRQITHQHILPLEAVGVAGSGHQRLGFLDRRSRVGLVAEALHQLLLGRGELREWIDETADHHRGEILDDLDQHRPVEYQMQGASDARIVIRLALVVRPRGLDHALIVVGPCHAGRRLGTLDRCRIRDPHIVHAFG